MAVIRYRRGQERDIVRETTDYKDSIFYNQYIRALEILNYFAENKEEDALKVIAFCGDRGDGKTSCMMSVLEILKALKDNRRENYNQKQEALDLVRSCGVGKLEEYKFAITHLIDPSFFDDGHNVLEIVVGQLYSNYCSFEEGDYSLQSKLEQAFQMVKRCLETMSNSNTTTQSLNGIENLNTLADAIELRNNMSILVECYLKYMNKDMLIVAVDDIDLSLTHAYEMCEQIRKYLAIPKCVVMLCVKIPQLQNLIAKDFRKNLGPYYSDESWSEADKSKENPVMGEADLMAKKYLDKLISATARIDMPKAYSLSDVTIEILGNKEDMPSQKSLSSFILELIFRRTRYLFYNPIGSVSPIIPNNLRELFNLVGLLVSMRAINVGEGVLQLNKNLFKSYFFTVWRERFDLDTRIVLDTLLNFDFGTSFNREIIKVLTNHFKNRLEKDYENEGDEAVEDNKDEEKPSSILYESIVSPENFGYNVTAGDVFYLFSRLEKETLSESGYALLFFLKSYYSMKLYEAYEFITENEGEVFPDTSPENRGLTVVDHRFDHTNKLQQLIGGSYFSYVPGDLIPKEGDFHIIEATHLHETIQDIKGEIDAILELSRRNPEDLNDNEKLQISQFDNSLQIMEYYILSIKCSIRMKKSKDKSKPVVQFLSEMRKNVDAFQFRAFSSNTGYYLFDVMAPFSNIINPKFSYTRFEIIDQEFYNKILNYKGSLLSQMIEKCSRYREHISNDDEARQNIHRLLSVAVIRNAEVLSAIKENILIRRYSLNKGQFEMLKLFYDEIRKCEMSTHRFSDKNGPYLINFHFLEPINRLINSVLSRPADDTHRMLFESIYQPISTNISDIKSLKEDLKQKTRKKRSYRGIALEIVKTSSFKSLNIDILEKFISETLSSLRAADIENWIMSHLDSLLEDMSERTRVEGEIVPESVSAEELRTPSEQNNDSSES